MEQNFIYLVDLNDYLVCINLKNTSSITSVLAVHLLTYKNEFHPIYYCDLEQLLVNEKAVQLGFSSPRFNYITLANWYNNGTQIGIGSKNEIIHFYSRTEIEKILKTARLEIDFEKVRRIVNPLFPSRLTCIFLAEDNLEGRTMLKNMFYKRKSNFLIEKIKIEYAFLFHKVDYRWIEIYEEDNREEYIYSYWLGKPFDKYPQFEYLLEGQISIKNEEALALIKKKIAEFH